jgi:DNA-binding MarR family transcriptional regulator
MPQWRDKVAVKAVGVHNRQQAEQITTALLVFGPLYSGWLEQQLPGESQGVRTRLLVMLLHVPHMPMRYYARLLGISKAYMTTLVDECTQAGLVVRSVVVQDRRASQLSLSETGRAQAQQIWQHYVTQTIAIVSDVSEAERAVFLAVCVQLTERLHAMGCGSGMALCEKATVADATTE